MCVVIKRRRLVAERFFKRTGESISGAKEIGKIRGFS
jgi:hypothetical protein